MAYKVLTDGAGSRLVRIVGMGDYMPAQMYSELETKNAELMAQVQGMTQAINNAYSFIPAGALFIKSDLKKSIERSPAEALRQVQVHAIQSATESIGIPATAFKDKSQDFTEGFNFAGEALLKYAAKVAKGEV